MKDDLTVLKQARALIEKPENFCQNAYVEGHRHCALGAVFLAATSMEPGGRDLGSVSSRALSAIPGMQALADTVYGVMHPGDCSLEVRPIVSIISLVNDTYGHAFIMAAFDTAIAKLEREVAQANTVQEIMQTALEGTEPTLAGAL